MIFLIKWITILWNVRRQLQTVVKSLLRTGSLIFSKYWNMYYGMQRDVCKIKRIHSVGIRVDESISTWEKADGSAVNQTGSWAPFTTTKAPSIANQSGCLAPNCASPNTQNNVYVCAYSTSAGAAKVQLSTVVALFTAHPLEVALRWRQIVGKSRPWREQVL